MEGNIFYLFIFFLSKTCYTNQRMSGYHFFAVECLPEVVVEKKKKTKKKKQKKKKKKKKKKTKQKKKKKKKKKTKQTNKKHFTAIASVPFDRW